jgi:hypothetical protein
MRWLLLRFGLLALLGTALLAWPKAAKPIAALEPGPGADLAIPDLHSVPPGPVDRLRAWLGW